MRKFAFLTVLRAMVLGVLVTPAAAEESWGDLQGRFLYNGPRPVAKPIEVTKDQAYCGKHHLTDETLVVGAENGIRNIAIWLHAAPDQQPPIHPAYSSAEKIVIRFKNCRFEPHMFAAKPRQQLEFLNEDVLGHNVNVTHIDRRNFPGGLLLPSNKSANYNFFVEEVIPVRVQCNIHPWMRAYAVVKDHPYIGITDEHGRFQIRNVPAGSWTFKVWQERSGYITRVIQHNAAVNWKRGELTLRIQPGETHDLEDILVDPANFEK